MPLAHFKPQEINFLKSNLSHAILNLSRSSVLNPTKKNQADNLIGALKANIEELILTREIADLQSTDIFLGTVEDAIAIGQITDIFPSNEQGAELKRELSKIIRSIRRLLQDVIEVSDIKSGNSKAVHIPLEIPAPIRVAVVNNRIELITKQSRTGTIDYPSANRIRDSLKGTLSAVVSDLSVNSNSDQRFLKSCFRLLDLLSIPIEENSIEALGLQYQLVSKLATRFSPEMGGIVNDELQHALTGIGVLLNQFQEWRDYLNELSGVQLDVTDGDALVQQARELAAQIESETDLVDRRISVRLKDMIEPVLNGLLTSDAIAAPLIGSLSNFFGLLSNFVLDNVPLLDQLGPAGKISASGLLLGYCVKTLQHFCPIISRYPPLSFVVSLVNWFNSKYSQGKDLIMRS